LKQVVLNYINNHIRKTNVFKDTEYIIVFRALEGRKALLQGVYKVNKVQKVSKLPDVLNPIIILKYWGAGPFYFYNLIRDYSLSELEERLVIDWGSSTVS